MEELINEIMSIVADKMQRFTDADQYLICKELSERLSDMGTDALNHEYLGELIHEYNDNE